MYLILFNGKKGSGIDIVLRQLNAILIYNGLNKTRYDAHLQFCRTLKIICFSSDTIQTIYKRDVENDEEIDDSNDLYNADDYDDNEDDYYEDDTEDSGSYRKEDNDDDNGENENSDDNSICYNDDDDDDDKWP